MNDLIELIKQNGLPLILLVGLVYWLKPYANRILNAVISKVECDNNLIITELTADSMDTNKQLIELMKELRLEEKAQRACIFLFHNGISSGQYHFKKVSNIIEDCTPGTKSYIRDLQNIPICAIWLYAQKIFKKEVIKYENIDEFKKECYGLWVATKEKNTKAILAYGIYDDHTHESKGFIRVEYSKQTKITDKKIDTIIRFAGKVESILLNSESKDFKKCYDCNNGNCVSK